MEVTRKVLTADRLIHEQILGLKYIPPTGPDGNAVDINTATSAQIFNALSRGDNERLADQGKFLLMDCQLRYLDPVTTHFFNLSKAVFSSTITGFSI